MPVVRGCGEPHSIRHHGTVRRFHSGEAGRKLRPKQGSVEPTEQQREARRSSERSRD